MRPLRHVNSIAVSLAVDLQRKDIGLGVVDPGEAVKVSPLKLGTRPNSADQVEGPSLLKLSEAIESYSKVIGAASEVFR